MRIVVVMNPARPRGANDNLAYPLQCPTTNDKFKPCREKTKILKQEIGMPRQLIVKYSERGVQGFRNNPPAGFALDFELGTFRLALGSEDEFDDHLSRQLGCAAGGIVPRSHFY